MLHKLGVLSSFLILGYLLSVYRLLICDRVTVSTSAMNSRARHGRLIDVYQITTRPCNE